MRAVSSALGCVLLVAATVGLAAAVGVGATAFAPADPPPTAALDLTVDAGADAVTLVHEAGDPLAVGSLTVRVSVAGDPLRHQPPVPFVGARGFRGAPGGPFNAAGDGEWAAGEAATLRLAGTNAPRPEPGDRVRVRIYADGRAVADVTATATT